MKKITIIIFSLILFSSCNKIVIKNDLEIDNLKGKVKSIKEEVYYSGVKNENSPIKTIYNLEGYMTYRENKDVSNGTFKVHYERDNSNKIIEEKGVFVKPDGHKGDMWNKKYIYNDKNQLVEKLYYLNGKIFEFEESKYDEKGNVISITTTNSNGGGQSFSVFYKYKYDNKHNIVEKIEDHPDSNTYNKNIFDYDDNGKLIYNYHELGKKGEDMVVGSTWTYKYDDNGNKIEDSYFYKRKLDFIIKYIYDERNNLILIKEMKHEFIRSVTTYEFDKNENWIKEIRVNSEGERNITKRIIEYYP